MSISVSDRFQTEFDAEINKINVNRAKITASAFIFIESMLLIVSLVIKSDHFLKKANPDYAVMYLLLLSVMIAFLLIFIKLEKNILDHGKEISVAGIFFSSFILCWCATISLFDQKSSGQIIVYVVAILSIAVAPYFKPTVLLLMYLSVQMFFLVLMPYFEKSGGMLFGNYINSTTFIIISWAISYMRYKKQVMEFNNEKIIQDKNHELERINQELEEANQKLEKLSQTDALTGVCNRLVFERTIEAEWNKCKRHGKPLSLIMIDIDLFKAFNDNYGHPAGDDCIRRVAEALQACAKRSTDTVARYGGEEFAIILSYTEKEDASVLAEQIRKKVEDLAIVHAYSSVSKYVTISLGKRNSLVVAPR